jgi:uncharacterized repeat protein (TIGR03987 family)
MSNLLPFAVVFINLALVLYTIGVWGEKIVGRLKHWQLIFFWAGFIFDTTGTTLMGEIAGKINFDLHGLTGVAAIVLMALHAVWATFVLVKNHEAAIRNFHRFSLVVWFIWLIPFFSGMIMARG